MAEKQEQLPQDDAQKIVLFCPHCHTQGGYDPVSIQAQMRLCENCGQTWWMGAVWVAAQQPDPLNRLMKALHRSVQSPYLIAALEILCRMDEAGQLQQWYREHLTGKGDGTIDD